MLTFFSAIAALSMHPGATQSVKEVAGRIKVEIRIDDLQLETDAGMASIDKRLRRAVRAACPLEDPLQLSLQAQVSECRRKAFAEGLGQISLAKRVKAEKIQLSLADNSRGEAR